MLKKSFLIILSLMMVVTIIFLPACSERAHDALIVAGSTSVQPYAEKLAEEFEMLHSDIKISVQGGGSSAGIMAAETGTADIGMSSRNLKDEEMEVLRHIEIAKDGLAMIVHPSNPVSNLTIEDISAIYTQEITNWNQLGGRDARIHVITREEGSGTRTAFVEMVMNKEDNITQRAIVQNSNGAVRLLVSDDPNSIGFISLGLVEALKGQKEVKAIAINGIEAIPENIINESYALFRPFLFVLTDEPEGDAKLFIDYILSPEGQEVLTKEGLISVTGGFAE